MKVLTHAQQRLVAGLIAKAVDLYRSEAGIRGECQLIRICRELGLGADDISAVLASTTEHARREILIRLSR